MGAIDKTRSLRQVLLAEGLREVRQCRCFPRYHGYGLIAFRYGEWVNIFGNTAHDPPIFQEVGHGAPYPGGRWFAEPSALREYITDQKRRVGQ